MQKQIKIKPENKFYELYNQSLKEFCDMLKQIVPYLDEDLYADLKNRKLTLFSQNVVEEYYGDVYATTYNCSLPCVAQAMRHRTINYSIKFRDKQEFYIPPIINDDESMIKEWLNDCNEFKNDFISAELVEVTEMATLDDFILKMKERKCTFAQLEINNVTNEVLKKYVNALIAKNHPRAEELKSYSKGSRCTFPDYICTSPCGFKCGVNETRKI